MIITFGLGGDNEYGTFGNDSSTSSVTPIKVKEDIKHISANYDSSAVIDTSNNLWIWGFRRSEARIVYPEKIKENIHSLYSTIEGFLFLDNENNLYVLGENFRGQLGYDSFTAKYTPFRLMENVVKVSTGSSYHVLVLDRNSKLWAWGLNDCGQVGNNGISNSKDDWNAAVQNIPVMIDTDAKFKEISVGSRFSLAIDIDGNIWAWGDNSYGQFGDGSFASSSVPKKVY